MESPVLIDISKDTPLKDIPISKDKFFVGRGLQNELVIENVDISRLHCIIEQSNSQWYIVDKSSNGTWLNDKLLDKMKEHKLTPGDVISLSDTIKFVFKMQTSVNSKPQETVSNNQAEVANTSNHKNSLSDDELLNEADSVIEAFNVQNDSEFAILSSIINATSSSKTNTEPILKLQEINVENYEEVVTSDNIQSKAASGVNQEVSKPTSSSAEKQSKLEYAEDELQCSICTEMFIQAVTLSCSHTFCKYCITQWQENHSFCPICRAKITRLFATRVLNNFIEKIVENASDDVKEHRCEVINQRKTLMSSTSKSATSKSTEMPSSSSTVTTAAATTSTANSRRRAAEDPVEASSEEGSDEDSDRSDCDDYDESGYYYGGYGRCFVCYERGHWANSCPHKRRR